MQGKICRVQDYPLFPDVKKGFLNLFPGWLKTSEELGFSSKMPNPVLFFPSPLPLKGRTNAIAIFWQEAAAS